MFLANDLSVLLSLNIIFYIVLGFAILGGFLRGFKKSLFNLITMAIFYIVFFVTLNLAVGILWGIDLSFLGPILADNIDPSLGSFTSFEASNQMLLEYFIGSDIDLSGMSAEFIGLAEGIFMFVLKIVWTILYFTVILILYKFICFIIKVIFVKNKKGANKMRGFGALVGAGNGLMAIFIMLMVMGGLVSIVDSMSVVLAEVTAMAEDDGGGQTLSMDYRQEVYQANYSVLTTPLSDPNPLDPGALVGEMDSEEIIELLDSMVEEYNSNIFVSLANRIQINSVVDSTTKVPLHLDLFDRVLSFNHNNNTIAFRYEFDVLSDALAIFATSEYQETQDLTDIKGDEIRDIFETLSSSKLIISVIPIAIEYASIEYEQDLPFEVDSLYDGTIDFETELATIGNIAGALFDILNGAGFIGGEGDLEQIEITGDNVRDLFSDISDSEVILLITETILFPMIEDPEGDISLIVTVPDDLDLETEIIALGEIFAEIVDSDIDFSTFMGDDITQTLSSLSSIDLTILLESRLVTEALINILSGRAGIEGLDVLTIPADIDWKDAGTNVGELRKILEAFNAILSISDDIDITNLRINDLIEMDSAVIETFFDSYVIRATVTDILKSMDMSDMPLVFPDTIYDDQDFFTKDELVATVEAIKLIIVFDDEDNVDFDPAKILQLTDTEIDTLFSSDILYATVGNYFVDMDTSVLVIPDSVKTTVLVDGVGVDVIIDFELKNIFKAINVLELTTFEGIEFDATYLNRLENSTQDDLDQTQVNTLLNSKILHATLSKTIIDLDKSNGGMLVVPQKDILDDPIINTVSGTDYIDSQEVYNALRAMYFLDITDFNTIDFDNTDMIIENFDYLMDSTIIHATVSDQILNIGTTVIVPEKDVDSNDILVQVDTVTFIEETELQALMDGLDLLDVTDPNQFDEFNLAVLDTDTSREALLTSAILHATISDQVLNVGDSLLKVPEQEEDGTPIKTTVGTITYVSKQEVKDLIAAMIAMGYGDVSSITQEIDPNKFVTNASVVLESASLQATVSNQILAASATLTIPETDDQSTSIKVIYSDVTYITNIELNNFFDAINLFDTTNLDFNTFNQFDFSVLDTDVKRYQFMDSAILHATISSQLLDLDDQLLYVPEQDELGTDLITEIGLTPDEFVLKAEINAIIKAMISMGYTDVNNLTQEINPQVFIDNMSVVLESASMQATVSNQLLSGTSALIVPDKDLLNNDIRIIYPDVTFIESSELEKFFVAIDLFAFTSLDFDTVNISIGDLQAVDKTTLLDSFIMQATISDYFLDAATGDETASPGTTSLLIPTTERSPITVSLNPTEVVDKQEIIYMLDAFDVLGFTNYNDSFNATTITGKTSAEIDTILLSNSLHITVDNMMRNNSNINTKIPALAEDTTTYSVTVTTKSAIRNFILATQQISGASFTDVTFNLSSVTGLDETQRGIVLESMIVRNILTPEIETLAGNPLDPYTLDNSDYMNSDPLTFLTKQAALDVIEYYYPS